MKTLHCEYCGQDFLAKNGQTRWHNCPKAIEVRTKIKRQWINEWRKRNPDYIPKVRQENKDNWKKCKCGNLTPNYFGRCDNCLSDLCSQVDMDFALIF